MKIKYFFPFLLAALTMVVVGCDDDDDVAQLGGLRVSQSFVSLDMVGGSASVTVTASGDWAFETADIPSWLTVSPASGSAGQTDVSFSAPATLDGRNVTLRLVSGSFVQEINVIQGKAEAALATCKEVIDGADGKTYKVKGHIVSIRNTKYGNIDIADETGQIYLYGTLDKEGKKANEPVASWGLEVGDVITVVGPKTTYNGVVELVDVEVVAIEKSLAKILSPVDTLKKEGGVLEVKVAYKGFALAPSVDEAYQEWVHFAGMDIWQGTKTAVEPNPADTALVRFNISANAAGERSGVVSFSTTKEGSTSNVSYKFVQEGSIVDVNISDFVAAPVGDALYRVSGVITKVAKATYGNVYIRDYSGEVYVYGIGAKGDFEAAGLKEGDVVTLIGKRAEYNGSAQMGSGKLESSISVTDVTIDEFLTKEDNPNVYYRVTGTVDEVANATYGNLYLKAGDTRLYVYGCYPGWGAKGDARKNCLADKGIEVGDQLTVIGVKSTYNAVPQVNGGVYFSHVKPEVSE